MTLRLADISARIEGVGQLGAVVSAMRGIAAARAQQAQAQLGAVDAYEAIIASGIASALALIPPAERADLAVIRPALVVFAAEQGFAGAYSEHVFDGAGPDLSAVPLFLVGTRGATVLAERGITPEWTAPMPAHSGGIPKLADRIVEALYARIAAGAVDGLDVVHAASEPGRPPKVRRVRLLPLDPARFAPTGPQGAPLTYLAPARLLAGLTADYLHAGICRAALHAFAAENETRMQAMAAAKDQVGRQLEVLGAQERQVRQADITAEVIELAAGTAASGTR